MFLKASKDLNILIKFKKSFNIFFQQKSSNITL